MDRGAWWSTVLGIAESDRTEQLTLSLSFTPQEEDALWETSAFGLWDEQEIERGEKMVILKMEQHEHRHRDMKEPAVFQEP